MEHNEISAICRRLVAQTLGIQESQISMDPWDRIIYDFSSQASRESIPPELIENKFQNHIEKILAKVKDLIIYTSKARQRYHDHYARQAKMGTLAVADMEHFERAIQMERDNLVKPLSEDITTNKNLQ